MSSKFSYLDLINYKKNITTKRTRSSSRSNSTSTATNGWHPSSSLCAFTHFSYLIDGFQSSTHINLFSVTKLQDTIGKPTQCELKDKSGRSQMHQIEYSRLSPRSKYSIHIVIYCPYWISNLTSLPITYSHPRINSSGKSEGELEVAAGQEVRLVEETYENQRWYPLSGWSEKLLKSERYSWSDRKGLCKYSKTKSSFVLPSKDWKWVEQKWQIDEGIGDEDGWMYASGGFIGRGHFKHSEFFGCVVRRRRWTRSREPSRTSYKFGKLNSNGVASLGYIMYGPNKKTKDRVALRIEDSTWSSMVDLRAVSTTGVLTVQARETPTLYDMVVKIMPSINNVANLAIKTRTEEKKIEKKRKKKLAKRNKKIKKDDEKNKNKNIVEEEEQEQRHGIRKTIGTSFHRTKLIQIAPHYIICNNLTNSKDLLFIKQHGSVLENNITCIKQGTK